jgi:glycogen debranching enzyme
MTAPVVLLEGNRFYVAGPSGDAGSGSEGLYADDVRVLSRWRVEVDGQRPEVLGGGEDGAHFAWSVYGRIGGAGRLGSRRQLRISDAGLRDTLTVTNYGRAVSRVLVRYAFDADFADLLEVKRRELGKPGLLFADGVPPVDSASRWTGPATVLLTASGGGWASGVEVSFSPGGVPGDGEMVFEVEVPSRGSRTVQARVVLGGADAGVALERSERDGASRLAAWRRSVPEIRTPWTPLAETYRRSTADLAALRMRAGGDGALLPAAGLPWFMTIFGRDTLLACLLSLALDQDLARTALRVLGELQAGEDDPARDAEPGKIVHEVRAGRVAARGRSLPYYGSVDSTPLYLMLAAQTWRWTGDGALMRELEPRLRAAMAWVEGPADLAGRGYVEFRRRAAHGLDVQSWKDSAGAMLFADGSRAEAPLAVCEVQGYAYAARLGLASIAREVWGDAGYADRLERDAADLRVRFDRDFWVSTADGGHYALALDGTGRRVDSLTSDIGHLLWTGIALESRVDSTVAALLGPRLFSGWGVRTMSTADAGYYPVGYHVGTVWPHDTALGCLGLAGCGRRAEGMVLLRALVDAAGHFGWRLPEVLAGFGRAETGFPVRYPTSSSPQAWAAAAPIGALTGLLGLVPDRATGRLTSAGAVPDDLDVTLLRVPALGRRWDVTAHAGRVEVAGSA